MYLLLDGCGTVLNRAGRLYLSTGNNNLIATKRSICDDRRTEELSELCRDFHVPVYLNVDDISPLRKTAEIKDICLKGRRLDLPWSEIGTIINGMDDQVEQRIVDEYKKHDKIFLLQGGAGYDLVQNDFVSAPNTVGDLFTKRFVNTSARHSSCNDTYSSTAAGLVLSVWRSEEIAEIRARFYRRSRDSGEVKKPLLHDKSPKPSHHAVDVKRLVPQLNCKIFSDAQRMPWEHYHRTEISFIMKEEIADADFELVKNYFRTYERCVYTKKPLGGSSLEQGLDGIKRLLRVSSDLGIPDGDILLPTYNVQRTGPKSFVVSGYNPQRSVVGLSILDWLWIVNKKFSEWRSAFDFNNSHIMWHGYFSLKDLKAHLEDRINWANRDLIRLSER